MCLILIIIHNKNTNAHNNYYVNIIKERERGFTFEFSCFELLCFAFFMNGGNVLGCVCGVVGWVVVVVVVVEVGGGDERLPLIQYHISITHQENRFGTRCQNKTFICMQAIIFKGNTRSVRMKRSLSLSHTAKKTWARRNAMYCPLNRPGSSACLRIKARVCYCNPGWRNRSFFVLVFAAPGSSSS